MCCKRGDSIDQECESYEIHITGDCSPPYLARLYCTDAFTPYNRLPEEKHLVRKYDTHRIERTHLTQTEKNAIENNYLVMYSIR
ncbi:IS1 family transposase [Xenorhabdus eapokensis]|uniref:IS1 family transposase n=1 Tax=Xenorhabdus eapokensis TaxID=1873482 RepID=UPI001428B347|nr:IS1 family transposase [Xenorhabdus eapokensis]